MPIRAQGIAPLILIADTDVKRFLVIVLTIASFAFTLPQTSVQIFFYFLATLEHA